MFTAIIDRNQLGIGSLVRDITTRREVFEVESYDPEKDYYELSINGKVVPQTGGKGDSFAFGTAFEELAANYEVDVVDGGFRNAGES